MRVAEELERYLVERNIRGGFARLDAWYGAGGTAEDAEFLFCLAQWVDLGYRDLAFLEGERASVDRGRGQMAALDFLRMKMVDGFMLLARRRYAEAIGLLDVALRAGEGVMPPSMIFVGHFWKGRAHRQEGSFDAAQLHLQAARAIAESMGAGRLVAVTKIHESWLVFHSGGLRQAMLLLEEAETELLPTGHALSLGNIAAARGRFVRSTGEYAQALAHFEGAIRLYGDGYAEHPNHARALVNAAYIKRLMALELQPKLRGEPASAATHQLSIKLGREAMELLGLAARIYTRHQHQGGTGSVLVNTGHLWLESGNIDQAQDEAAAAFALGESKQDGVLMARARILQASVELALSDEQVDDGPHARLALQHAEDAIRLAQATQNKRLLAGAYIMRGLAAADDHYREWETAKDYAAKSGVLLGEADRDHLYRELGGLKLKIQRSGAVNETLRRWSEGDLGGKTFQQIEEEFAEIVIPKVWLNAGRNVTQVAKELSISPKKVRRILRSARYVEGSR